MRPGRAPLEMGQGQCGVVADTCFRSATLHSCPTPKRRSQPSTGSSCDTPAGGSVNTSKQGLSKTCQGDIYISIILGPSMEFTRQYLSGHTRTTMDKAMDHLCEAAWRSLKPLREVSVKTIEQIGAGVLKEHILKNWMTHDAMWFLHCLQACGIEETNRLESCHQVACRHRTQASPRALRPW